MKLKLNCLPHLKTYEIPKKLFNVNFLSDVQFSVGGKIIYAHSLMLMMRSEVFEAQLEETCGEKKLIPINDCSYESFLEFMRFVYTDECELTEQNGIELLKLATKYGVVALENRLINELDFIEWYTQLFGHCVTDNYEIARNKIEYSISYNTNKYFKNENFLSLHPDAVNAMLQLDEVSDVTEIEIFNWLVRWIENYCKQHKMSLSEGGQKFNQLIRQVRFPAMSTDEIRDCAKNHPELLSVMDCKSIAQQVLFGSGIGNDEWMSKPRINHVTKYEWREINRTTILETKFSVSKDTILHGLWVGVEDKKKEIEIVIEEKNKKTNESEKIQFTQSAPEYWADMLISLGNSIRVRPNFEYTIAIKYLELPDELIELLCRKKHTNLIYNNPNYSIEMITASDNMLEMMFKPAPE